MKQITKLILISILSSTINQVVAQGIRNADLRVEFISPDSNSVYTSPVTILYTLRIFNQGPDTIWPGDSISFQTSHSGVYKSKRETYAFGKMLTIGDSIDISSSVTVNSGKTITKFQIFFTNAPQAFGFTKDKGKLFPETNETIADNRAVVTFKLFGSSNVTENELTQLELYPNPVTNGEITISGIYHITHVKLFTNTMRLISKTEPQNSSNSTIISLKNIPRGLYFIQIATPSGICTKQILVN